MEELENKPLLHMLDGVKFNHGTHKADVQANRQKLVEYLAKHGPTWTSTTSRQHVGNMLRSGALKWDIHPDTVSGRELAFNDPVLAKQITDRVGVFSGICLEKRGVNFATGTLTTPTHAIGTAQTSASQKWKPGQKNPMFAVRDGRSIIDGLVSKKNRVSKSARFQTKALEWRYKLFVARSRDLGGDLRKQVALQRQIDADGAALSASRGPSAEYQRQMKILSSRSTNLDIEKNRPRHFGSFSMGDGKTFSIYASEAHWEAFNKFCDGKNRDGKRYEKSFENFFTYLKSSKTLDGKPCLRASNGSYEKAAPKDLSAHLVLSKVRGPIEERLRSLPTVHPNNF